MLDRVIDDVTDTHLLGSAIYSRWRYFNHWAYDGAEILEPENRAWFILALNRLALLSEENPFIVGRGNNKPDIITKIILDYHRVTRIKPGEKPEGTAWEFVTWDYTEHLIIDR